MRHETWQFFCRQLYLQESFPQQKAAAKKRVESGHTSHLGKMGPSWFCSYISKGLWSISYEKGNRIDFATHCGYRRLSEYMRGYPNAFVRQSGIQFFGGQSGADHKQRR